MPFLVSCYCRSSTAILLYLSRKYNTPDHWYPSDIQKRARVDEYLSWHHANIRANAPKTMWIKVRRINIKMHSSSLNLERVCHAELTNLGLSWLEGAVREGALPNCSTSGSGKSSFSLFFSFFFIKTCLLQKVSKPNRLPLPGFVKGYVTDLVLPPRAPPSLHSCAECAQRQKFCCFGLCFVAGNREPHILHTTSPCSPIRVEIQKEPSASSSLRYCSEMGSGTDRMAEFPYSVSSDQFAFRQN